MNLAARKRQGYRSGHCSAGAVGGHARCHGTYGPTVCTCTCHTPPTTEDIRP